MHLWIQAALYIAPIISGKSELKYTWYKTIISCKWNHCNGRVNLRNSHVFSVYGSLKWKISSTHSLMHVTLQERKCVSFENFFNTHDQWHSPLVFCEKFNKFMARISQARLPKIKLIIQIFWRIIKMGMNMDLKYIISCQNITKSMTNSYLVWVFIHSWPI